MLFRNDRWAITGWICVRQFTNGDDQCCLLLISRSFQYHTYKNKTINKMKYLDFLWQLEYMVVSAPLSPSKDFGACKKVDNNSCCYTYRQHAVLTSRWPAKSLCNFWHVHDHRFNTIAFAFDLQHYVNLELIIVSFTNSRSSQ